MAKSWAQIWEDLRNTREVFRGNMIYNPLGNPPGYVRIVKPSPGDEDLNVRTPEARLRYLKRLHELGLIDDTVYQEAQREALR